MTTKVFEYQENGLSYTVTIYEEGGQFKAAITVNEGAMDVNAIYYADDDISGASAALKGPLNMNGAGSTYEGEKIEWDEAVELSLPGLGPDGTDKATFVSQGETHTVDLDIDSLDEIDFFGIRATSTTTDAGSIKGVSGDPEEHQDPVDPEEPEEPTYSKVFFGENFDAEGDPDGGVFITVDNSSPTYSGNPILPEGTEPTFENYVSFYESLDYDNVTGVQSVVFYQNDADGVPQETFRIDAPNGTFANYDELLQAYDDASEAMDSADAADDDMMFALMTVPEDDIMPIDDEPDLEDEPVDMEAL